MTQNEKAWLFIGLGIIIGLLIKGFADLNVDAALDVVEGKA